MKEEKQDQIRNNFMNNHDKIPKQTNNDQAFKNSNNFDSYPKLTLDYTQ